MALTTKSWPAAAAGVALVSDGAAAAWAFAAYVTVIAAATIDAPSWLSGFLCNIVAAETHYGDIALATGGVGTEVDACIVPYAGGVTAASALTTWVPTLYPINLPVAIYVPTSIRLAGRLRKNTGASAAGFVCKFVCISGTGP